MKSIRRPKSTHCAVAVVVLAGLVLAVFSDVLFARGEWAASGPNGDVLNFYNSCRMYGFGEIRHGNVPLWNPHVFSGVSFIGNFQSALFYPPNLIYLFLPLAKALNLDLAFHVFLMGALTFAWARGRGLTRLASFFAGVTAMFSGAFFMHVFGGHLTMIAVFAWSPLLFLAVDKTIEQPRVSWVLGGAFAVTMMLLAGSPHPVFIVGVGVGLYVLLHLRRVAMSPKRLAALAVMAAAPLLLTAIQLWPSLEVAGASMRGAGASYDFTTTRSFPPENFLLLIMPGFFGDDITRPYWGRWTIWETGFYVGVGGLVLVVLALLRGDRRAWWRFLIIVLFLTLVALGRYTPFFGLLHKTLPGFGSFRAPARFLVVASLLLAMLAGQGLDAVVKQRGGARARGIGRIAAVFVLALGLMLLGGAAWVHQTPRGNGSAADAEIPLGELARAGALCSLVGAMLLAAERWPKAAYGIVALGVVEMTAFAWTHRDAVDLATRHNALPPSSIAKLVEEVRVLDNPAVFNRVHCAGGYEIWGNEAVMPSQYVQFLMRTIQFKRQISALGPDPVADAELSPLLSMLRLKYVMLSDGTLQDAPGVPAPLPRFLLVHEYRVIEGLSETFDAMEAGGFDPSREVILESEPDPAPSPGESGSMNVLSTSTDSAVLEVDTPTPAILINTDSYAPGWRARPLRPGPQPAYNVLRANGVIRAVPLAAGKHTILLEYVPRSYLIGRWVSLVSVALFAGVTVASVGRLQQKARLRRSRPTVVS
ncbi:MAG TPA: hypothetical protein VMZ06_12865 [Candidatus Bathyarchaeia archaeon]|nr:hypothetical protein [Candidatus Bathyarchaeia archaeon]